MIEHHHRLPAVRARSAAARKTPPGRRADLAGAISAGSAWGRQAVLSIMLAGLLAGCGMQGIRSLQWDEAAAARDELAESLVAGGNRNAAIRLYQSLAGDYPYDPDPILKLGDLYLESNDLLLAEAAFQEARARGAGRPANIGRGRLALTRNEPGKAITAFRQVLSEDAENFQALNGLGVAYDLKGDHARAQEAYEKAMRIAPNSRPLANNLALSLALSRHHDRARSILQRLVASPGASERERMNLSLIEAFANPDADTWPMTQGQSLEDHQRFLDFWFSPVPRPRQAPPRKR